MQKSISVKLIHGRNNNAFVDPEKGESWRVNIQTENLTTEDFDKLRKVVETMNELLDAKPFLNLVE